MAAAQERVFFSSGSHRLSDYVCQGPSAQKMNRTLAPFKTLTEVSDIQKNTGKECIQCRSKGSYKYSGRISGQVCFGG